MLEPLEAGKRSPLLLEDGEHFRSPPALVGEQVPDDVRQDAEGERSEEQEGSQPRRPLPRAPLTGTRSIDVDSEGEGLAQ